jgi:DNA-directed RNA polymerase specialized sigma subunit
MGNDERTPCDDLRALLSSLTGASGAAVDKIRTRILEKTTFLIDEVIRERFPRAGFAHEELFRAGYLGLLNATYNPDLAHEQDFCEYARHLISGEIREHIRERVRRSQFPQWLKDLNHRIEERQIELLHELDRLPTLRELSDAVNITEEGIAEIFKAREALNYISLDATQREHDPVPVVDLERIRNKRPDSFPIQYRIRVAAALEKLADLQQLLFRSLFPPTTPDT